jgi:hypothetical protein
VSRSCTSRDRRIRDSATTSGQYAIVAWGGERYRAYRMTVCLNYELDDFYGDAY